MGPHQWGSSGAKIQRTQTGAFPVDVDADQPYYIGEKKAVLYGVDDTYITQLVNALEEGSVPQNDNEVMLSSNAKLALDHVCRSVSAVWR